MSESIKVVYDSRIFSQQRFGGVSRYYAELHHGMRSREQFDSLVVAGLHSNSYLRRSAGGVAGVRLNRFPGIAHRLFGRLNDALARQALPLLAPDIVHYTTYVLPENRPGLTITTVHDFIHDLFPEYFDTTEYAERQAAAVEASDGIVCISESTRRDMEEMYGSPSVPVLVSHHGVSGQSLPLPEVGPLAAVRRADPTFLYVGSRFGYKGFDVLLEALAELDRQPKLVCVGASLSDAESAAVKKLGLDASQLRTIAATDRELVRLYRSATALVYPSRYEGFGLPVVEAMAQGCPVVCARTSSLPEVGGAAARYFDRHAPDAIAETLATILADDDATYEATSARCVRQARSFTWEAAVDRHAAFYRRMAG